MLEGCTPWPKDVAKRYRDLGYWQRITIPDVLARAIRRAPDKTALVHGSERIGYRALGETVDRLACGFIHAGIRPLDRVVVQLPNIPEFVYTYFANTEGLVKALKSVGGDISGGQKKLQSALAKTVLTDTAYGRITLDQNRNAITEAYMQQLYTKGGKLAVKTAYQVPNTTQSFGGIFTRNTPSPGRNFPACTKRTPPRWVNNLVPIKNGIPRR